jgi:hypothetical protein
MHGELSVLHQGGAGRRHIDACQVVMVFQAAQGVVLKQSSANSTVFSHLHRPSNL